MRYKCPECKILFEDLTEVKIHIRDTGCKAREFIDLKEIEDASTIPMNDNHTFTCGECNMEFNSRFDLIQHQPCFEKGAWNWVDAGGGCTRRVGPNQNRRPCGAPVKDNEHLCDKHLKIALKKAKKSLLGKIQKQENGCWIWQHSMTKQGYGYSHSHGLHPERPDMVVPAHRLSLFVFGKGQQGLGRMADVHHICKNPSCINPEHLVELNEQLHTAIHNLNNPRVANAVLVHMTEAYPELSHLIIELQNNLTA